MERTLGWQVVSARDLGPALGATYLCILADDLHHWQCLALFEQLLSRCVVDRTVDAAAAWMNSQRQSRVMHEIQRAPKHRSFAAFTMASISSRVTVVRCEYASMVRPRNARTVALPERDLGIDLWVHSIVHRREVLSVKLDGRCKS